MVGSCVRRVLALTLVFGFAVTGLVAAERPAAEAAPPGPRVCAEIGEPANAHYNRSPADRGTTITAEEAIARACDWIGIGLTYSQSGYHPDRDGTLYRRDCSGYVSMAWHADTSYATSTIAPISEAIPWSQVQPGDAVIRRFTRGHIEMITQVHDDGMIDLVAFGSTPPREKRYHITALIGMYEEAIRYEHMENLSEDMVRQAIEDGVPEPSPIIQPPNGVTLVQFPTNFYVEDEPFNEVVELVGLQVELWAEQTEFVWDFDDDTDPEETDHPGEPYPGADMITHPYVTADVFEPTVDVTWGDYRYRILTDDEPDPEWIEIDGSYEVTGPSTEIEALQLLGRLGSPGDDPEDAEDPQDDPEDDEDDAPETG